MAKDGRQDRGKPDMGIPLATKLPERPPHVGELVHLRSRRWLVEEVVAPARGGESSRVLLACADDDAQGQSLEVFWDYEIDRRILEEEGWSGLAARGFDPPRRFAAFFHTLRWHCTTATDPNLFQAPFRAGITIDAYQMEPLRKALRLPRVNLFIADDTGLGKTIEAGLIARELLLRRKVRSIVTAAPPSVLEQWKGELEDRFGLVFDVLDRAYVSRMRRERGFGVNPWRTHSRFLVSHNLLIDPAYTDPLREWLGPMRPGSLLILDEAHHAAPSSGGRYGIETKFTRAIRDLSERFEHRLFLSATPHNGHSNSFSTLLELLDPYRFTRGVTVRGRGALDDVMVRRLKEDVREIQGGFPKRNVVRLAIGGLPADAPELALSRLLDEYRTAREERHAAAPGRVRAAAGLLVVGLQQRLLSSIEAFARSLRVHRETVERQWRTSRGTADGGARETSEASDSTDAPGVSGVSCVPDSTDTADAPGSRRVPHASGIADGAGAPEPAAGDAALFLTPPDADDERAEWTGEEMEAGEKAQIEAITRAAETGWTAAARQRPDDSRADTGASAESGSHPNASSGAESGSRPNPGSDPEPVSRPDTGSHPDADPNADPESGSRPNLRSDAESGPHPDTDPAPDTDTAHRARERRLLDRMQAIAEESRHLPDAKTRRLIDWIRENQCPALPPFGQTPTGDPPPWNARRALIFTENREGTKRYLRTILERAVEHTHRAEERIEVIDGLTGGARRKEVQRRFNADPARDPLRILIATDAAREGLNLQAHCTDLFHFDLPWNPGRIEQRNGRIDRKLQPASEVRCHYFVLPQRTEDRVLEVLVTKTGTIKRELGSLSRVIDDDVERRLRSHGIRHREADALRREIEAADLDEAKKRAAVEELEEARERRGALEAQIERCRSLLARSREWTGFAPAPFRDALSCALELLDAPPLGEGRDGDGRPVWTFPPLERRAATDPSWTATLDSLRAPRRIDQKLADWRRDAPIRPVVFEDAGALSEDTVHLHLEQRIAQRLLARFRAQGFVHHDLSRACLAQTKDSIPRVILLGRLCLYGRRAERLHEELVPVAARWVDPARRTEPLRAYAREAQTRTLALLDESLGGGGNGGGGGRGRAGVAVVPNEVVQRRLLDAAPRDVAELRTQLEPRALEFAAVAERRLAERGGRESRDLHGALQRQRERVVAELARREAELGQLTLAFAREEMRQLEADMRHWRRRLDRFERDLEHEPARVREFYEVRARRVEPVGLVYLWPETN